MIAFTKEHRIGHEGGRCVGTTCSMRAIRSKKQPSSLSSRPSST